jgi:hypothetical protein
MRLFLCTLLAALLLPLSAVQLGKKCFNAVTPGVREAKIFPGEDGLLGNALLSNTDVKDIRKEMFKRLEVYFENWLNP